MWVGIKKDENEKISLAFLRTLLLILNSLINSYIARFGSLLMAAFENRRFINDVFFGHLWLNTFLSCFWWGVTFLWTDVSRLHSPHLLNTGLDSDWVPSMLLVLWWKCSALQKSAKHRTTPLHFRSQHHSFSHVLQLRQHWARDSTYWLRSNESESSVLLGPLDQTFPLLRSFQSSEVASRVLSQFFHLRKHVTRSSYWTNVTKIKCQVGFAMNSCGHRQKNPPMLMNEREEEVKFTHLPNRWYLFSGKGKVLTWKGAQTLTAPILRTTSTNSALQW